MCPPLQPAPIARRFSSAAPYFPNPTMPSPEEPSAEQLTLITNLAPYFRHLNDGKDADAFFERLFNLWFVRWRLKLQDYGRCQRRLDQGMNEKMQWIRDELQSAASLAAEGPVEWQWQAYMRICEGRLGVPAKRKYGDVDGRDDARPRPQPRPKKVRASSDGQIDAST
ncbi:hypothetical protein BJ912DRAFT_1063349 [Pholiota molesta]|nr:hypothetical protein BJ912DRAFT_1063349 [Pholiota molesta]